MYDLFLDVDYILIYECIKKLLEFCYVTVLCKANYLIFFKYLFTSFKGWGLSSIFINYIFV